MHNTPAEKTFSVFCERENRTIWGTGGGQDPGGVKANGRPGIWRPAPPEHGLYICEHAEIGFDDGEGG